MTADYLELGSNIKASCVFSMTECENCLILKSEQSEQVFQTK